MPVEELDKYEIITRAASNYTGYSISKPVTERGTFKIYGLKDSSLWAVVSEIDFEYLNQWRWSYARSPWGKIYICRRTTAGKAATRKVGGFVCKVAGASRTVYVHREVMLRKQPVPPSPEHKIVGHDDGNSLDCRRENLHWSTYKMNNTAQHGRDEGDEEEVPF